MKPEGATRWIGRHQGNRLQTCGGAVRLNKDEAWRCHPSNVFFGGSFDPPYFLKSIGVTFSSRRGDKKNLSLHTLHEPARLVRKFGKNGEVKIAKSLVGKEINFFIFLVRSKIVQAHLVLSGPSPSVFSGIFWRFFCPPAVFSACRWCSTYFNTTPLIEGLRPCRVNKIPS